MRYLTLQPGPGVGKDTYSDDLNPDVNYGAATTLAVMNAGNPMLPPPNEMRSFIQFGISSLPAGIMRFNSAVLTLTGSPIAEGNNIDFYQITSAWDYLTLTHNIQPVIGALITSIACTNPLVVDIVDAVRNWYSGAWFNYGIRLSKIQQMPPNRARYYSSRELAFTTLRPRLVIGYDTQIVDVKTIAEDFY